MWQYHYSLFRPSFTPFLKADLVAKELTASISLLMITSAPFVFSGGGAKMDERSLVEDQVSEAAF